MLGLSHASLKRKNRSMKNILCWGVLIPLLTCFYFSGRKQTLCSSSLTKRPYILLKKKKKLRIFGQKSLISCQINAQFHGFPKGMFCTLLSSQNPPEMWWALFPHGPGATCCLPAFLNSATHTARCQVISINRTRPVIYSNNHIQVLSGIVSCRSKCYVLFSLPFKHFISK